ncbi:uncharacterized protein LOC129002940 [Macrosteles quadrilineatus]|uniref:uncharacterized protein LOC129002940 n=1 Tax=Macrosteles quadrilineatus TaxID=74068 RepID=UPI0023E23ADA|nr:uncharacterized protein LOC129002940 [Macrosteles quadrilineatus]
MKLLFTVVFGSFLICQGLADTGSLSKGAEIKGHVLDFPLPRDESEHFSSFQALPNHIDPENKLKNGRITEKNVELVPGKSLLVKCVEGDNEVNAFVYGSEGYFIDRLKLGKSKMVFSQLLYISVSKDTPFRVEDDTFTFKIIYKFNVENTKPDSLEKQMPSLRCYSRYYQVKTILHYHTLRRLATEYTNCEGTKIENESDEGVSLLPWDHYEIIEFHQYGDPFGDPVLTTFEKTNDALTLKCQQYNKIPAGDSTIATGYIVYKDIILEKISLDTCTTGVEGICIKENNSSEGKEFTLLFKQKDGNCFKMNIWFTYLLGVEGKVSLTRDAPSGVNCPNDWTSDAALEVEAP